jgi:type IV secretory pathway VirJ component
MKKYFSLKKTMNKFSLLTTLVVSLHFCRLLAASSADSLTVAPFGKVYIYNPKSTVANVVIMISGDGGWKSGVVSFAEEFSKMNNIVIGVDILRYFKDLRLRTDDCYHVASDFVQLATDIEKKYNFPEYKPAVIMGYSSGATLVYGILAQARPGTFIGGISLGFCPDIELPKMLCQTNGLTEKTNVAGKSYFLEPDAKLGNHWIVLQGKLDKICNYKEVADFVSKTTDAELITLPEIGHGFSKWSDFMPQWKEAFARLTEISGKDTLPPALADHVKDLPLQITNAKNQINDKPVALLISGDGGWYSFEQSISDNLAGIGIPTIGLDSKKYFWKRRTPEQAAQDIAMALNYYSKVWGRDQFILIGYSLGAEIVPFIVNRLPPEMKLKILSSVLLSPDLTTDFEIHISNMLGMGNRQNTYNVTDEIKSMQPVPTLIIFGNGEKTDVPDLLNGKGPAIRKIPGDHHYKFDVPLIVKTMKEYKTF